MYMKSQGTANNTYRVPENYNGNAFHGDSEIPSPPVIIPIETNEDTPSVSQEEPAVPVSFSPSMHEPQRNEKHTHLTPFLPPRIGGRGGLLGDVGVEELLIIGLLFLLSQSDSDQDILLLLLLLLFYK